MIFQGLSITGEDSEKSPAVPGSRRRARTREETEKERSGRKEENQRSGVLEGMKKLFPREGNDHLQQTLLEVM